MRTVDEELDGGGSDGGAVEEDAVVGEALPPVSDPGQQDCSRAWNILE